MERFQIEERRVETECAERAFERSSVNPRKRERVRLGDPRTQYLLLIKRRKTKSRETSAPKDVMALNSERGGERWRVKNFNPMKGKRKMDPNVSAGDIGAGQSVHPLVAGACGLALWAVAFGFLLTGIEIHEFQGILFIFL